MGFFSGLLQKESSPQPVSGTVNGVALSTPFCGRHLYGQRGTLASQGLPYFPVDSGKTLISIFLSAKQCYYRECLSWDHITSFALKQKPTAVPKIVCVILSFLLVLSLPTWCFKYIVSLFWKVWYHCTWWELKCWFNVSRIRSSVVREKKEWTFMRKLEFLVYFSNCTL